MQSRRYLAAALLPLVAGACDIAGGDPAESVLGPPSTQFGKTAPAVCQTITFDDFSPALAHGDQVTSIPTSLGFTLAVTVTPGTPESTNQAVVYDTDNPAGPDTDLQWDGAGARCPACNGLGNVLVIASSRGFATEGDSDGGGVITLTGFPASGVAFIESYYALDQETVESATQLFVDGVLINQSSGQGDGSVEEVLAASPAITQKAELVLGGSGGVDNIKVCAGEPAIGRMTGGGAQIEIDGVRVSRGLTIHCDITLSNNLEINWPDNQWHISKPLTHATCIDDPAIEPAPPAAPFDTFVGEGTGRLNGVDGSIVRFTFVDSGEPGGKGDHTTIRIWAPGADPDVDAPVLDVSGPLDNGNLQAHYDQPHGSNVNK